LTISRSTNGAEFWLEASRQDSTRIFRDPQLRMVARSETWSGLAEKLAIARVAGFVWSKLSAQDCSPRVHLISGAIEFTNAGKWSGLQRELQS
jgi:hypothetical protein